MPDQSEAPIVLSADRLLKALADALDFITGDISGRSQRAAILREGFALLASAKVHPKDGALAEAERRIDAAEREMIAERRAQYGSAFRQEQLVAIQGMHQQQRVGARLMAGVVANRVTVEQVADAVQTAIESNTSPTYVDNLGDGESIIIDGTINLAVLTEELNKL